MTKQTFAEKMEQAKADRKRNIKLSIKSTPASKIHTRCQKTQYVQPLTATQILIQGKETRIEGITDYLYKQYKQYQPAPRQWPEFTPEIMAERKALETEKMTLLHEAHYLRNPQRTPEMDEGSDHEAGGRSNWRKEDLEKAKASDKGDEAKRAAGYVQKTITRYEEEWDGEGGDWITETIWVKEEGDLS